jgi:farnesyl-diphosphate farnesyltransferase
MCVAYLLCRIADTIEDEPDLDDKQRTLLYDRFLEMVDRPNDDSLTQPFLDAWPDIQFAEAGYKELVHGSGQVLAEFRRLPIAIVTPIRRCVHDMVAGMRTVRPMETLDGIAFYCRDLAGLDVYCHIVAGTVGIMSTALFEWHIGQASDAARGDFQATDHWRENGRRLGLGLQMTNIIKDCRIDAERGVSFIPAAYVRTSPGGYVIPPPAMAHLLRHTIDHLDAGLAYTLAVPAGETGIRRFLLGSLLPAIATLDIAAPGTSRHPKIDRTAMMEILNLITDETTSDSDIRAWYKCRRHGCLIAV